MENTKAVTEDGIPDRIIDLQEPSNRRTVVNSVEQSIPRGVDSSLESTKTEKKKDVSEEGKKTK